MAITLVGSDSGSSSDGSNITLTMPTTQADDFAIITTHSLAVPSTPVLAVTVATGYTELFQTEYTGGTDRLVAVFYKKLAGAATNPVMTSDDIRAWCAAVHVFRGVNTTTAFDVAHTITGDITNDETPLNPAITPITANGCLILYNALTHNDLNTAGVPATPSGLVMGETILATSHQSIAVCYKLDYGSAVTITPTAWTHDESGANVQDNTCVTFALRPAGGAAPRRIFIT